MIGRKADALDHATCFVHVVGDAGGGDVEADLQHRRLKRSRSSAVAMASASAPISSTP